MKQIIHFGIIFMSITSYAQTANEDSLIIQFANTYGQLRHFHPQDINSSQWHNFLAFNVKAIKGQTNFEDFFHVNIQSSFPDVKLSQKPIIQSHTPVQNPVYWQHIGCGPASGNLYKSVLVNYDSLTYLDNGFNFGTRIEEKFDSLRIEIKCHEEEHNAYRNIRLSLLSYGWETGQQNIFHSELHVPQTGSDISTITFNQEISNVFFSLYFIITDTIDVNVKYFNIIGYKNGNQDTVFHHSFNEKIVPSEITIGEHHSTEIRQNNNGLQITCLDTKKLKQLFPRKATELGVFETKLGDKLFLYLPLITDENEIIHSLPYEDYSKDDFPTIAKCALIETYCRTKYFNPNLKFVDLNIDSLLITLYHQTEQCRTIYDLNNLLNSFLAPIHDGHITVYNYEMKPTNKCLDFDVSFIKKKCYVIRSNNEKFEQGDEILKINNEKPWKYLQRKIKKEQGSYQKELKNAELYLMCGDSTQSFEITYRHGIRKKVYVDLPKSESAIGIWAKNATPIQEVETGIYVVDLYYTEESELKKLIADRNNVKGFILDARKGIRVSEEMLTYLTQDTLFYPIVKIPMYSFPDQKNCSYKELNTGVYITGACNRNIPMVLITTPRNISSEETFVSMAIQIPTCSTLGEYTGGCNGVSNTFYTIGGFEIGFTGSVVNKQNGEQLFNVGFSPNFPVTNTKKAIKKNEDLMIKKAVLKLKKT